MLKRLWIGTLLLWLVGDTLLTLYGLSLGMTEGNPTTAMILMQYGLPGWLTTKAVFAAVIYGVGEFVGGEECRYAAVTALLVVSTYAVVHNTLLIIKLL